MSMLYNERVFVTVQGLEEAQSMVGIFARIRRILFYGFDLNDNVGIDCFIYLEHFKLS